VEKYPLYSRADEALFVLGQDFESQITRLRARPVCTGFNIPPGCVGGETTKAKIIDEWTKQASAAYSQIITRYPLMDHADDARKRLAALHQPIPRPTRAAVAQNRAEEDSRREANTVDRLISVVKKGPDTSYAAKVGEPTLVDPTPVSANQLAGETLRRALGAPAGDHGLSVETVKGGTPGPNEAAPRSDAPASSANADPFARPATTTAADPNELKPIAPDPNALTPAASSADPNELKPTTDPQPTASSEAVAPPVQLNEIQQSQSPSDPNAANSTSSNLATDKEISSSKKKKKTGLKKIIAF
jgi:hypothetical protein